MTGPGGPKPAAFDVVRVTNPTARGRFIIVCEHASNAIPEGYGTLGLAAADLERHIAWDPGARGVAAALAQLLDAPLVECLVSRLILDCNRPTDAPDLIAAVSETTPIPGNAALSAEERVHRITSVHAVFHDALETLVADRLAHGLGAAIVTIHSFNPVYRGVSRPWHVGVIHDDDRRLADPMMAGLEDMQGVVAGRNQPYSPADRVYYTLERHARPRDLPCAMIEIRNDEIADEWQQTLWAQRLATILSGIQEPDVHIGLETASNAKGQRRSA